MGKQCGDDGLGQDCVFSALGFHIQLISSRWCKRACPETDGWHSTYRWVSQSMYLHCKKIFNVQSLKTSKSIPCGNVASLVA